MTANKENQLQGTCPIPSEVRFHSSQGKKPQTKEFTPIGRRNNFIPKILASSQSLRLCIMDFGHELHPGHIVSAYIPLIFLSTLVNNLPCKSFQRKALSLLEPFHCHTLLKRAPTQDQCYFLALTIGTQISS